MPCGLMPADGREADLVLSAGLNGPGILKGSPRAPKAGAREGARTNLRILLGVRNRRYLGCRQIKRMIPEPKNQRANRQRRGSKGGRPAGFDKTIYERRNEVERTINALKSSRALATRFDKRAYASTAPSPWLRSAFGSIRDHLAFVTRSGRDDVVPDGRPARGRKDHESAAVGQGAQCAAADAG